MLGRYSLKLLILFFSLLSCKTENSIEKRSSTADEQDIEFSVNAFSFHDLLTTTYPQNNEQVFSLLNLLDWFHYKKIKAIDPTGYYFPGYPNPPSDAFIHKFTSKAKKYGIKISGTGIRNDFAHPDPKVRGESIKRAIAWLAVASKLEAPVLRCFAGKIPKNLDEAWEKTADRVVESVRELIPYAKKYGVKIGIQNHGDVLRTADQCAYILDQLNSEWVGLVLDTGHFHTDDPYKDIEEMVPYAVNWQIKEYTDGSKREVKMDYSKIIDLIISGGYKGFVPVESLKKKNEPYDPFERVDKMLVILNQEVKQFNSTLK